MEDAEFTVLLKECITSLYLCADNVAKYVEDDAKGKLDDLKSQVKSYCLLESRQKCVTQALEAAKRQTDSNNLENLQQKFTRNLEQLTNARCDVDQHRYMLEFNRRVGQRMVQDDLDESDIAIMESQERFIDPLTKTQIQDPVKNLICGHVYDKKSISEILRIKRKVICPVAGCGNKQPIREVDLITDDELKFRMTLTQHSTMLDDHASGVTID